MNLNFADNLKHLRKEKGLTQEKLAEALGVSSQSISRWELEICYPDLELLPVIANYFGVTVDALLCNDTPSKEKDAELFWEKLNNLSADTTDRIEFVSDYCRKYPENDTYALELINSIMYYTNGDQEKVRPYLSVLERHTKRLLDSHYRYAALEKMAALCEEQDLKKWLDMMPYSGASRRYCLILRAQLRADQEETHVQQGLGMLETMAEQLDTRFPDHLGAERKSEYQKTIMKTVRSLGENGNIPDGWRLFYAYKQLVLSACLFRLGKQDEAWENFDQALESYRYILSLDQEWLDVGGLLFSDLRVSKDWNYAIDKQGNKHKLFGTVRLSFYHLYQIRALLTNPSWAWFNSVRDSEKFRAAVEWVKAEEAKQDAEEE